MKFVRYGRINKMTEFKTEKGSSYHAPPEKKGLFAFPEGRIEMFLVAWKYSEMVDKSVGEDVDGEVRERKYKELMRKDRKVFEYDGYIWHHFTEDSRSKYVRGSWALDAMVDYKRILKKNYPILRLYRWDKNGPLTHIWYSKDHFEVFIPSKIA